MSIESEEKATSFKNWKQDLELRAEAYVAEEAVREMKFLPQPQTSFDHPLPRIVHGDKIEVVQSKFDDTIWRVELNGALYHTFAGDDAHERALRFVNDAVNYSGT